MKIYHVETQQTYDALMVELEEKGLKWRRGEKPTNFHLFKRYGKDTYIYDKSGVISLSSVDYFKEHYSDEPVIEYKTKTKGENMTQEEMKRYFLNESKDVSIAIEIFVVDDSTTENSLSKAKSSAKKLIEKIDEYLESLKPEFKVGDYVTYEGVIENKIAKIDSINEDELHGLWYEQKNEGIRQDWWLKGGHTVRHATPEEIAEYEAALTFHKHGRKPFELKKGDLIEYPTGQNIMIYHPDCFSKTDFLNYEFKLVKTVEEVNEWLENK